MPADFKGWTFHSQGFYHSHLGEFVQQKLLKMAETKSLRFLIVYAEHGALVKPLYKTIHSWA